MATSLPSSLLAAIPVAMAAGFVSFLSPCVLPLVPGYLAFLSGSVGAASPTHRRGRTLAGSLAFVLGFAVIFVSFGAAFGGLGSALSRHQRWLEIFFGALTMAMGLFFAGWWPAAWAQRERRSHYVPRATVLGAFVLGFLFALGWTPCIGPTLGAILGLAASSGASAWRGSLLAFCYCLGLGLPFVVIALAGEYATTASKWLRRHSRRIGHIGGIMLIAIGLLEATGLWAHFVLWLRVNLPTNSLPL